ncbi:MAG: hypothetical protein EXS15_08365 [Phycisphaerales bacterium]|nr:hypothetical protein [Phycisphaerales bacterium]
MRKIQTTLLSVAWLPLVGCVITSNIGNTGARPITRQESIATWSLTDGENELFNVIVSSDGAAVSTWWKGEHGTAGERGRWELVDGALDIRYGDGWRDVITTAALGYHKVSYAPGLAPNAPTSDRPSNVGQAVLLTGDEIPFVGVWTIPGALAGAKYEVIVALRSDGMAMKNVDAISQGTWQIEAGTVHLYWADGWHTTIENAADGTSFSKSWKPGLAISEMPTGSGAVQRMLQ